jgi:penicillin-binding protein 1C
VLDAIGARRFAATLNFAGARVLVPEDGDDDTGLAIALGGLGMTVRDLAVLYAALGDGGRALPLNWVKQDAEPPKGAQIMSAASAREIVRVLAEAPTPQGRMPARLTQEAPVIAFKTGTSYGFRDAWAAGVGGGYAVVVWVGRADSAPRPGVTGRDAALPMLFEVYDAIARVTPARASGPALRDEDSIDRRPPAPLARFGRDSMPPHIIFPPHNSEVWTDDEHRSLVLAAEGAGRMSWYVDGAPLQRNAAGDAVWKPGGPGFYSVTVVDPDGRSSGVRVRVRSPEG